MDSHVNMLLVNAAKFFPESSMIAIRETLEGMDPQKASMVLAQDFKDPTIAMIISAIVGAYGIDRFYIGTVTCVDLLTEMFVSSVEEVFREFGFSGKVEDFFVDGNGIVYLLTDKGLYNVDSKQYIKVREKYNLQDLETYKGKYLLLFYETGEVDVIELSTGTPVYSSKAYEGEDVQKYNRSSVVYRDDKAWHPRKQVGMSDEY